MTRFCLLIATLALLISGCANSPPAKFYTLSAQAPRAQARTTTAPVRIAIDSVTVPELVDRPQIVVRIDATQVGIDEFARWAEPLKAQITRVLAADLAQSIAGALVSSDTQWAAEPGTYRVSVAVQSFESAPGDTAAIEVLWTVRPPNAGEAVSGRASVRELVSGQGYDALVDAHSRALASISSAIAGAIGATIRP